jgi:hypothetical protein
MMCCCGCSAAAVDGNQANLNSTTVDVVFSFVLRCFPPTPVVVGVEDNRG